MHKRSRYTQDLLPGNFSVSSEKSVSNLTTTSDSPDILPYYDLNTLYVMKKYIPLLCRTKIGYCCIKHDKKDATKRQGSIATHALIITRNFIIFTDFRGLIQRQVLASWKINIICPNFQLIDMFVSL